MFSVFWACNLWNWFVLTGYILLHLITLNFKQTTNPDSPKPMATPNRMGPHFSSVNAIGRFSLWNLANRIENFISCLQIKSPYILTLLSVLTDVFISDHMVLHIYFDSLWPVKRYDALVLGHHRFFQTKQLLGQGLIKPLLSTVN